MNANGGESRSPAITFAIPFYRGVEFLERAVRSVANQTRADWTLLVVDDGGPDGEAARALVDAQHDERMRYVRYDNAGLAGNWNRCLDLAPTNLVTVLHADDELLPRYADVMIGAHARHRNATAVSCAVTIIDEDGRPAFSVPDIYKRALAPRRGAGDAVLRGDDGLASLLRGNHVFCPTLCYRRDALDPLRFDDRWRFVLDLVLMAEVLLRDGALVAVPDVAYRYRRHAASQTALLTASSERFAEEAAIHRQLAARAAERGWARSARTGRLMPSVRLHATLRAGLAASRGRAGEARRTLSALRSRRRARRRA